MICIENYALFFMVACISAVIYAVYATRSTPNPTAPALDIVVPSITTNYPYTYPPRNDPLLNPYAPPLRDERYLVPVNISTNIGAVDTHYRQVGFLTLTGEQGSILPLMGRPLFTNRAKWQYYTMSDQRNQIKLPVVKSGRSCTSEYGCDQIMNGDTVLIEGQKSVYQATLYDSDTIQYLPVI